MSDRKNGKPCTYCQNHEVVEGTLEGVSFQSLAEGKKILSSGVYGIRTTVCTKCGHLSSLFLDTEALRKMLR